MKLGLSLALKMAALSLMAFALSACMLPDCTESMLQSGSIAGVDCVNIDQKNSDQNNNEQPSEPPTSNEQEDSQPEQEDKPSQQIGQGQDVGIVGLIRDANSQTPLGDVVIVISKACTSIGCSEPVTLQTQTDDQGEFGNKSAPAKKLSTYAKNEAIKVEISKPGYSTVIKYFKPDYNSSDVATIGDISLCLENSADADGDTLCDSAEEAYHTNAYQVDTDGDAISDTAEIYGTNGLDLAAYGAKPLRKNIFLELDYYPERYLTNYSRKMLVQAFASAPIKNIDGSSGIDLYLDFDDEVDPQLLTEAEIEQAYKQDLSAGDPTLSTMWGLFDERIKAKYFNPQRQGIFHYGLRMEALPGRSFGGLSRGIVTDDFITNNANIATVMHELGHNLGLYHGGTRYSKNYAPHYFSVMNYLYSLGYYTVNSKYAVLDYSRISVKGFSEEDFNEVQGLDALPPSTEQELAEYRVKVRSLNKVLEGNASANVDINDDGQLEDSVEVDVDNSTYTKEWPNTQNDWQNLRYSGGRFTGDAIVAASNAQSASLSSRSRMAVDTEFDFEEPCPAEH